MCAGVQDWASDRWFPRSCLSLWEPSRCCQPSLGNSGSTGERSSPSRAVPRGVCTCTGSRPSARARSRCRTYLKRASVNAPTLRCWRQPVSVSQEAAECEIEFRAARRRKRARCLFIHTTPVFWSAPGEVNTSPFAGGSVTSREVASSTACSSGAKWSVKVK